MKTAKPLLLCAVGLVGGCATTSQLDNANIQIGALESRIARIEKDLYRVEVKSAPKQVVEPKFVPATEVEQNVIDTKIDAFLKEYLGAQFGDSIDLYPGRANGWSEDGVRQIQVKKPFGYLDKAIGWFEDRRLYKIWFVADIDLKYSEDSANERIDQTLADMAVTFGLASDAFQKGHRGQFRRSEDFTPRPSYGLSKYGGIYHHSVPMGFRGLGVIIENDKLQKRLMAEKRTRQRAQGEILPEKRVIAKVCTADKVLSLADRPQMVVKESMKPEGSIRNRKRRMMRKRDDTSPDELEKTSKELRKELEKLRRDRETARMEAEKMALAEMAENEKMVKAGISIEIMPEEHKRIRKAFGESRRANVDAKKMSGIEKTVKTDSSDSVAEHHDTDMGSSAATRLAEAERGGEALHEACTTYYIRNKKLPISLDRLLEGNEPVLKSDKDLYDPWVNKYEMEVKGELTVIKSAGGDGVMDTEDDIRSDAKKEKD